MYVAALIRDTCNDGWDLVTIPDRHSSGSLTLVHERLSRRPAFRDGVKIRLADDQVWTLPSPTKPSESETGSFGPEYPDIIQAIIEVTDSSEQRLAELALVIFLLGHNYNLSPLDYECVLGFSSGSPESAAAQLAFHRVAQEHLHAFLDASGVPWDCQEVAPTRGRVSRLVAWLRIHSPFRWWSFDS